jgi:apolipoprotein N-acyltransferase
MISISNNAWFTPSIEPTLQKLLMQYYSKLYGVTIYAVANGSSNWVIGE